MIGKILLLTAIAAAQARHVDVDFVDVTGAMIPHELCPAEGHYLLPHEWDCTKFYYCEYGKKWEKSRDCAPGTEFSYALQVCVHPGIANCELPRVPPESEEVTDPTTAAPTEPETEAPTTTTEAATRPPRPTTEAPTEAPTETETEAPTTTTEAATRPPRPTTEAPTEAPTEPETEAPTTTEVATTPTTAATTQAPTTEAATKPTTAAPTQAPTTEAATEPETEAPTTTEASTTPTTAAPTQPPTTAPEQELLPNGCPADFHEHLLLPHETRCDKFYYCVFGEKVVRECAPGTHFNPAIQVCDWPENVNCVNADSEELDPEGSGDPDIDDGDDLLPNGCPADFDVHKLLPHESDCSKYYYCVFGETVERECGEGTLFNPEIQVCDWPQNVDCANSGNSNEDNGNSEEDNGNSEEDNGNNGESGSGNNSGEEDILENGCPADFDVHKLLPHENDCGKFYYCVHGNKVERECSGGTHFNPIEQVCDWPESAGCAISGGSEEDKTTAAPETTTAAVISTTTSAPGSTPIGVITTSTAAPESTTAPVISTTAAPETTSAPTTQAPEQELLPNGCPADFDVHQLLPHDRDCSKFYYCVRGEKVERECSDGLFFNPALQVCDWPANVNCTNSNSGESNEDSEENEISVEDNGSGENISEEDNGILDNGCPADFDVHQLLPHESDCAKFYYCVRGEKVERECNGGTHFNPVEQVCDWPQNAGCANAGSNEDKSVEVSAEDNGSGDNGSGDNSSGDNDVLDNGCPADFDIHQLLPHETDCGKFYYCVHGEKVLRECSDGTHFNPTLQVCDWPHNAGCANSGSSGENGSGEETTVTPESTTAAVISTTTSAPGSTPIGVITTSTAAPESTTAAVISTTAAPVTTSAPTTQAPEQELLPNGCPADFDVHLLLPHESNCSRFYYCVHGEKVERECPDELHFNPTIQVCDWPANVGCSNANSGESNGNSEENDNSAENGNSEENGNGGEDLLPNGCPADFDVHKLLPNPYYCDRFFDCVNGAKVERECSGGTHFNYELQVCDWPENVNCVGSAGNPVVVSSEESTEVTDPILPNGCPADFNIHQLLPHESDCAKFYQCAHGEKVERDCGPGTHFNPTLQVCDWPQNAGCVNTGSGENETSAEGSGSAEVDSGEENRSEESGTSNENGETGESSENSNENGTVVPSEKCQTSCNIPAWAHEHDCDKFWRCDGGNAVLGTCSEGLHFNVNAQTCDFICNAGCVRDEVQSTPEHDGLKLFLPWDKVDKTIRKLYLHGQ